MLALITLVLAPWQGPSLATATPGAHQYKLTIRGAAHQRADLQARIAKGWIASFCTPKFCSPMRYSVDLGKRGVAVVEFQAIRLSDDAPKHVRVTITAARVRIDARI
jgi:hypothetical protein